MGGIIRNYVGKADKSPKTENNMNALFIDFRGDTQPCKAWKNSDGTWSAWIIGAVINVSIQDLIIF